jgi:hypothetical protein
MAKRWNMEELNILYNNYQEIGAKGCNQLLPHRPVTSICSKAKQLNIKFNVNNLYKVRLKDSNSFAVNPNMFLNCKLPETAYLLGFIWGDGHIVHINTKGKHEHKVITNILTNDMNHIRHIFDLHGKWNFNEKIPNSKDGYNRKPFTRIYTSNRLLVNFLEANDYHLKSGISADKILNNIPINLRNYFILGLIDADGCFNLCKNTKKNKGGWTRRCIIASTYDQDWTYLEKILSNLDIKYYISRRITKIGKGSVLTMSGLANLTKLYNYLYPNKFQFGLKRKYDKCLELLIDRH